MITHELIERIEGEALIDFRSDRSGRVRDAQIRFLHFRGMEAILEGRHPLDALVIAPRVCGICGHSHLIAAVEALEAAYRNSGAEVYLSAKARSIRTITKFSELLQNHLKWLYLIMLGESAKMLREEHPLPLKALNAASQANRLAALFSGQWPHSSYALPGGVTCDPTHIEMMQATKLLAELERFVETEVLGCPLTEFEAIRSYSDLRALKGDFGKLLDNVERLELADAGHSHGRFLVLGEYPGCRSSAIDRNGCRDADASYVSEDASAVVEGRTYAKNALYEGAFYETGPLARALVSGRPMIGAVYEARGDDASVRIAARVDEIVGLLKNIRGLIERIDLAETSFIVPPPIETISGEGRGIVEAPRGSLIHTVCIDKGRILSYDMITPTQWNLGNGTADSPGVAQKAMIGAQSRDKASFLFRTFDVCSVCTTH
ncbi:MAG: nickel-dependent hydrogenase large subunit [Sulfuricurvum sp.]|nr:nickel-dependent hydrogenase large subunit [Sulfuricurvum sp.]